jgi:hypothetical protein
MDGYTICQNCGQPYGAHQGDDNRACPLRRPSRVGPRFSISSQFVPPARDEAKEREAFETKCATTDWGIW